MKSGLLTLLLAFLAVWNCRAQLPGTTPEPVRYEDGTTVDEAAAAALFAKDRFRVDTTVTGQGDTLLTCRHESAFLRLQFDGLPADAGIDRILLVPMKGEVQELGVTFPETGSPVVWLAKEPGALPAVAAVAEAPDGRLWSVRLPGIDLQAGTAYRRDLAFLTPEAPAVDLQATPLPATVLDVEPGEYSGITHISGNRYAVVDDGRKGGGIVYFVLPLDSYGQVGTARMLVAEGTNAATGKAQDGEGIAFVPSTGMLYVSNERQEIREYDLAGRETGKALSIPEELGLKQIQGNRGFEALSYDETSGLFWTTTEAPLKSDGFLPRLHRLQSFTRDGEPAESRLYQTDEPMSSAANTTAYVFGIPALAALDDGRLLVLEREVYVPQGGFWDNLQKSFTSVNLYLVDPVHDAAGILRKSLLCSFRTGALDLANFEGMCLGPALPDGQRSLVLIADSEKGSGGLTQEYVKVILLQ